VSILYDDVFMYMVFCNSVEIVSQVRLAIATCIASNGMVIRIDDQTLFVHTSPRNALYARQVVALEVALVGYGAMGHISRVDRMRVVEVVDILADEQPFE